jgi:transcriptional regulator with XRE-family HTH domain
VPDRAKAIGENLSRLRDAAGLTLRQLAKRAGVHYNTVANVEHGLGGTVDTLERLSGALGVPFDDLVAMPVGAALTNDAVVARFKRSRWCEMLKLEGGSPLRPKEEDWLRNVPLRWLGVSAPTDKTLYLLVLARREQKDGKDGGR